MRVGVLHPSPLAFTSTMRTLSDDFLKDTIKVWQPLSAEPLTAADAREIAESMTGFFAALARCKKEAGARSRLSRPHNTNAQHDQQPSSS